MKRPIVALAILVLLGGACASKRVRQPPDMSGFLDDYSLLREGGPDQVRLVYRNPDAQWSAYDKILFEPVTLWRSGKKSLDPVPEEDLLRLVSDFETALRTRLGSRFGLVETAGPGVMRIRLGITEARVADPILDVLAARGNAGPRGDGTVPLHPELRRFIERADIEGEIRDAQSGELLAQGVDRRRTDGTALPLNTWADVDRILDLWADRLLRRLEERTGR
jgi:uncharacterized protein DUF3313